MIVKQNPTLSSYIRLTYYVNLFQLCSYTGNDFAKVLFRVVLSVLEEICAGVEIGEGADPEAVGRV